MSPTDNFQAGQILCLEYGNTFLYAELIQIAAKNKSQQGWVRPLALKVSPAVDLIQASTVQADPTISDQPSLYDLRQGADLLCPITLFRAALDTEVIPLLTQLANSKAQSDGDRTAHHRLHRLIQDVCQVYSKTL